MKKLKSILLIDDDEPTNFLNKIIIQRLDCAEEVITLENGLEGLEHLIFLIQEDLILPEIIFLDINMPVMNGWEFLEEYKKIHKEIRDKVKLYMLTTSVNPDDKAKADNYEDVIGFISKPLSDDSLNKILNENYFS